MCGHVWGEGGSAEGKKNETDTGEKQEKPEWQGDGEMVETIAENSQFPEPFKDGLHSPSLGFRDDTCVLTLKLPLQLK